MKKSGLLFPLALILLVQIPVSAWAISERMTTPFPDLEVDTPAHPIKPFTRDEAAARLKELRKERSKVAAASERRNELDQIIAEDSYWYKRADTQERDKIAVSSDKMYEIEIDLSDRLDANSKLSYEQKYALHGMLFDYKIATDHLIRYRQQFGKNAKVLIDNLVSALAGEAIGLTCGFSRYKWPLRDTSRLNTINHQGGYSCRDAEGKVRYEYTRSVTE